MLIHTAELLHLMKELSPTCREPQVYMDRPHCNCMVGIDMVRQIVLELSRRVEA